VPTIFPDTPVFIATPRDIVAAGFLKYCTRRCIGGSPNNNRSNGA